MPQRSAPLLSAANTLGNLVHSTVDAETNEQALYRPHAKAKLKRHRSMAGQILVSYHYPCPDGVFAAMADNLKL